MEQTDKERVAQNEMNQYDQGVIENEYQITTFHPFRKTGAEILIRPNTAPFRKEMTESAVRTVRLLGPA